MLLGGFWIQFAYGEMPCPLCVAQRLALSLAAIGPAWVILQCRFGHRDGASMLVRGMAVSMLAAIAGLILGGRYVLLDILPGEVGYGTPVLGLSLYTWVVIACMVILLVAAVTSLFHDCLEPPMVERLNPISIGSLWLLILVLLLNAGSVFAESGFHLFLPADPTGYRLLGG